jgi:hypothetical protein
MNTRAKTIVMAVALAAAASALGSQAADQSAYFDQQRQLTDGYFPDEARLPSKPLKPATPYQTAQDKWLGAEIGVGSTSFKPIPFPVLADTPAAAPVEHETPHQVAQDQWLTAERTLGSGSYAPISFPPPSVAQSAIGMDVSGR